MSDPLLLERDSAWEMMSPDERLLMAYMWRRILKVGRAKYGPLDVASDNREHVGEAVEEAFDGCFYMFVELRKMQLKRERIQRFIDCATDTDADSCDEVTGEYSPISNASQQSAPIAEYQPESVNLTGEECADCSAPHQCRHRMGCPRTVVVPPESEVA